LLAEQPSRRCRSRNSLGEAQVLWACFHLGPVTGFRLRWSRSNNQDDLPRWQRGAVSCK
jgi:hypothetical protein